jgi:hypothetical protein
MALGGSSDIFLFSGVHPSVFRSNGFAVRSDSVGKFKKDAYNECKTGAYQAQKSNSPTSYAFGF